jgi:alpha-L-rhamnosidase
MMKSKLNLLVFCLFIYSQNFAQSPLKTNFQTPPNAAKPRVWWHWMNGNISKEGIQKDLEWMNRVGIGGFQNFDAALFTPVVVPKKIVFMTPEWKDAFKFTTNLADKLKLEMAIAGSPGWSVTGGPWVEPKDAMKKYVFTETKVEGGKTFSGKLPQPGNVIGKFQNAPIMAESFLGGFIGPQPVFYQDAMVIAYRLPANEIDFKTLNPKVSSSGGSFNLQELTDANLAKTTFLPPTEVGQDMWVQYEFATPQTFKAFSISGSMYTAMSEFNGVPLNRALKVSDDGINFREIARPSTSIIPFNTIGFQATTAKYWRICFTTLAAQANMFSAMAGGAQEAPKPDGINIAEFVLYNTDRIDQAEDKAGFTPWKESPLAPGGGTNIDVIENKDIIDLTTLMKPDGTLEWQAPPPGAGGATWSIIRFGYSLTGRQNHPASPEATGLEVDKLDKEAVRKYINTYLDMYKDATGGLMGAKGLQYMVLDSYEAGHMTWTKNFPQDFQKKRGYSILPWMPVLAGRVVKSVDASEKFLWDFRKTIGEMIAENHYDVIGEELHKRGMKRYTESHEDKRIFLADGMDVKRNSDIPMSAMWTPGSLAGGSDEEVRSQGDIRESASVANIYGKPIVAAESMTSVGKPFQEHPEKLKRTADLEFASGLNRFVIHTSVHQPLTDKKPGFSLGPFGQYFTRQETWAEAGGKAWMEYLGRSSYMFQQGKNVADILYYYGENTNITWLTREKLPEIPAGYEFDFVNSNALIDAIEMKNGKLTAKSGNTYSLLVLDETAKNMTLPVLKKIQKLVKAGAKLAGTKPEQSPSLTDNQAEFQTIVNDIWNSKNITTIEKINAKPDVIISNAKNKILYRHRRTPPLGVGGPGQDIYWLNNRADNPTNAEVSFRIAGKVPEIWNAQTGEIKKVSFQIKDGRTIVPLKFESWEAYFVVFKEVTAKKSATIASYGEKELQKIEGNWEVSFQENAGAPASATFTELKSWTENADVGIKYFSGTATYKTTFKSNSGLGIAIDLGDVKNMAEVIINGRSQGFVWKKPFKIYLKEALNTGENSIEIKVTNSWPNRLIGDAQPDVKEKTTFTTMPFYRADSPLLPSGLLGPVRILVRE